MATALITRALAAAPPPLPPGARKKRIFDAMLRGFLMELRQTGGVTFWFRYTDLRHRRRELPLGRLGDVTADQARKRAQELRAQVSLGGDPAADRDRRRAAPSFADFVADRFLPHVRDTLRAHADYEAMCRLRLVPTFGRKALDEVSAADVIALRRSLMDEGLSNARVNRHLAVLRRIFSLALRWEIYEGRNPAQHPGMLREQHRERFLTEMELRALMLALGQDGDRIAASAIMVLALTGARRGEVLRAEWAHVDVERRHLLVPLSKSGRRRAIPLNDAALALLAALPRAPGQAHLFPSARRPGHPVEGVRAAWARAKRAAGLPADLRLHDLRHNFASLLINTGWSLYEVGQILGHTQLATTTRYAHLRQDRLVEAANAAGRIALGAAA